MLSSPEAATGRLGAVLRAVGEPGPVRLADHGPWLTTSLDQARAVLTDPARFDFPQDVSRRPARAERREACDRGPRSPRATSPHTTAEQVALGRTAFATALDEELRAYAAGPVELDAAVLLRRPMARATTSAVLEPAVPDLDRDTRDAVADAVLRWIDALAPVIASVGNPSRWSRVRRAEDRARRSLERLLAGVGVDDPAAAGTVLAAGIQVPVAAGAWLLVHLANDPDASQHDPVHIVWETLRVTPPTWMSARVASVDVDLAGHAVAAGEIVLVSPLLLGQLAELVPATDDRPHQAFAPGRWTSGDVRPGAWLPFGAGPHACPGRSLGMALLTDLAARAVGWDLTSSAPTAIDQSRGLFPAPARVRARLPEAAA